MALIPINGIKLNVEVKGEGRHLILIHGVGGDMSLFTEVAVQLSEKFRVITMDCRGHGLSDKPGKFTMDDHVADVLGIIDYFGITTTFLNGVSMGSYIAQAVAIAAPKRISKLILTVPKSNGLISSIHRLISEHSAELTGLNQHQSILMLLKYMTYDAEAMKKHIGIFETKLNVEQFYAANKAVSTFDFRTSLSKIEAKTLVISGKYDGLNPPEEGKLCAMLIPGATYVEMQYSGHAPIHEEPGTYLKIIENFLLN